ncbi:cytochrome c [Pararhodobacter sp.]|uniref:c-type cytochrome n=1 Tax=Pararhodobacter sp. TaxID=2127056 RepID=UPI002AFE0AF2|nr:cytochrome c [Pararhodobacter sp.]
MRVIFLIVICLTGGAALADHELLGRDIEHGQGLYAAQCASCHGLALEGQPDWQTPGADGVLPAPPHDDTGHTWHHDNGLLFDYTKQGGAAALEQRGVVGFASGMPAFAGTLSDDEIWDVLAYIRATWSPQFQDYQADRNPAHNATSDR